MRIVHLISNHKFTGPVDPALGLVEEQLSRGVDVRLGVGRSPLRSGPLDDVLRHRGLEPLEGLTLPKHRRFLANRRDARRLVEMLLAEPVDVIHAHLDNAHETALRVRRYLRSVGVGQRAERVPLVVRSLYDGEAPEQSFRFRRLYGPELGGVFVFGAEVGRTLQQRFEVPAEHIVKLDGAVSAERFYPRPGDPTRRARLGLPEDAIVVGIVARIQKHRRYEVLFEAVRRVMDDVPQLHLLVLGRGTYARELAHERSERLGIADRVCLPGYVGGDDYVDALSCFDFKVFLVPGSDGTCRAVREALAMGIPTIVSRRGLLPEMVRDGEDGRVIDDDVESLAAAIGELAKDPEARARMGASAARRARECFSQRRQGDTVLDACGRWLARRR